MRAINCRHGLLHRALQFIREELGVSFPYKSYKQVFVEDDVSDMTSFASLGMQLVNLCRIFGIVLYLC